MLDPDEPNSVPSSRNSNEIGTPISSRSTQSPASSITDGTVPNAFQTAGPEEAASSMTDGTVPYTFQTAGPEEGPSRPITPRPTFTWPMTSKEDGTKQAPNTQSVKDKILIQAALARPPTKPTNGCPLPASEEGSATPVAPIPVPEAEIMTQMLPRHKDSDIQGKPNPTPSNEARFIDCWENKLLPNIVKILDNNIQGAYSINVRRGLEPDQRVIDLMTQGNCAKNHSEKLEDAKSEHLLEEFRTKTLFDFRSGKRGYCVDDTGSEASWQSHSSTRSLIGNRRHYSIPVMGDSVGTHSTNNTATLGPLLELGNRLYRLVNWHLFDDDRGGLFHEWDKLEPPPGLEIVHPSPSDLAQYSRRNSLMLIGKVVAYSGPMYKTTRVITSGGTANPSIEMGRTTTDWALCETTEKGIPNKVRHVIAGEKSHDFRPEITRITSAVMGGETVYSTGRSSGYTEGEVCRPGFSKNDDGSIQRDWAVCSYPGEEDSWREGMGIFGDSGAGIIDRYNDRLVGQLWGRNNYDDDPREPAITYFTRMTDIFDDIQARWPGNNRCPRPKLPDEVVSTDEAYDNSVIESEITDGVSPIEGYITPSPMEGHLNVGRDRRRSSIRAQELNKELAEIRRTVTERIVPRLLRPMESGGRRVAPRLIHGDLWEGNAGTDRATAIPKIFDACSWYARNEFEIAPWRPVRQKMGKPHVEAYIQHFPPAEPIEDFDGRNALHALTLPREFRLSQCVSSPLQLPTAFGYKNLSRGFRVKADLRELVERYPGTFEQ
ncbi:hypothetical protein PG989_002413 [Apiospora arundinis]